MTRRFGSLTATHDGRLSPQLAEILARMAEAKLAAVAHSQGDGMAVSSQRPRAGSPLEDAHAH